MKIVKFLGGLGNQMFQYAFYKSLSINSKNVKSDITGFQTYSLHNGFELENIFNISMNNANPFTINLYDKTYKTWHIRKLRRLLNLKRLYFEEREWSIYDENTLKDSKKVFYWGYWQNEKYFKNIEEQIRNDFIFKNILDSRNHLICEKIKNTNSVSIHIRRGDYVNHPLFGDICNEDYYVKAIKHIQLKVDNPEYFIFSNDISWCKKHLKLLDATFIDWNIGKQNFIDMQLMSYCKHNVIANSSFSWWAAWLNNNENKMVFAPKKWRNDINNTSIDILPEQWIKI